ncbi:MAG: virulence RhuM family protein [Candidatus Hydrogenedentes bacterium]|nr:virulence RhuM family protein [Candidatus Hydrogenedentota bacterium]
MPEQHADILIYQAEDGRTKVSVRLEDESAWLPQTALADLFETSKQNISLHIRNILEEGELEEISVVKEYLTTAVDGKRYRVKHYNLDMVLAVGYRVRSPRGVQFRQWATERLREYIVKGFTMDDDRLKMTDRRTDYFDELLARIREIRASEARVYQRIREIFSLASDYVEDQQETQTFFATMQNKMHFAATGLTAAEIIHHRANAALPNMGLTSWKSGRVLKRDIGTAKNYLDEKEIDTLNRITVMFLDQAEFRAQRRQDIRMKDWELFLDKFLRDTDLSVLGKAGSVSREQAIEWANEQYVAFAERRRLEAETAADERYIEDLRNTAKSIEEKSNRQSISRKARRNGGDGKKKV